MSDYTPKLLDYTSISDLARDVELELHEIQSALNLADSHVVAQDYSTAIDKPTRHQVVYATSPLDLGSGDGYYVYNGSTWIKLIPFQNPPIDGMMYIIQDGNLIQLPTFLTDAPSDGSDYVRRDGGWVALP